MIMRANDLLENRLLSAPGAELRSAPHVTVFGRMKSRVGALLLVGDVDRHSLALRGIYFAGAPHAKAAIPDGAREDVVPFEAVVEQITGYFDGERTCFDVALAPRGTTFQQAVWRALSEIPYGETTTYAGIARAIGRPKAIRAVGAANGRNPLSIIVPCHRVIGQDGTLTGYAGGLDNKRLLLELESRRARG